MITNASDPQQQAAALRIQAAALRIQAAWRGTRARRLPQLPPLAAAEPRDRFVEMAELRQGAFIWANPDHTLSEARVEPFMMAPVQQRERDSGRALLKRHPPLNSVVWRARPRREDSQDRYTVPSPFYTWLFETTSTLRHSAATLHWSDPDGAINCFGFVLHCLYGAGLVSQSHLLLTRDYLRGAWWTLFGFEKAQPLSSSATPNKGDLLFFTHRNDPLWVAHIAMCAGRDDSGTLQVVDINATPHVADGRAQKRPLAEARNDFGSQAAAIDIAWVDLFTSLEHYASRARQARGK